jgi:hypothetical protein
MRTHLTLSVAALAFVFTAAAPLPARATGPVVSPPGSSATISADIAALVEDTYPVYDDLTLARSLSSAARTLAARTDSVSVRTLAGIERVMGLTPSGSTSTEVDTSAANYRVNATAGKAFAARKNDTYQGLPSDRFSVIEGTVQTVENNFLSSLGLPADELMKVTYRRVLAQSLVATSIDNSDGSPTLVRRGVTFASRGYAGFPIEGSEVRVSSFNGAQVDLFGLRWPKFQPHRAALSVTLDSAANVKRAIVAQVSRAALSGDPLSLYMGVVFQRVRTTAGELVYLPAMKVVVVPQPKLVSLTDRSLLTEGGMVFYTNLLATPPADVVTADQSDANSPTAP